MFSLLHTLRAQMRLVPMRYRALRRRAYSGSGVTAHLAEAGQNRFLIPADDEGLARELATKDSYRQALISALLESVDEKSRVLIVGAHVGGTLVPVSFHVSEVVAIEPNPLVFPLLRQNVMHNNCASVRLFDLGASDIPMVVPFYANLVDTASSQFAFEPLPSHLQLDSPQEIPVRTTRLDTLLPGYAFDAILFDIQGAEAAAMRGAKGLLQNAGSVFIAIKPHLLRTLKIPLGELVDAIPDRFQEFRFVDFDPKHCFSRDGIADAVECLDASGQGLAGSILMARAVY